MVVPKAVRWVDGWVAPKAKHLAAMTAEHLAEHSAYWKAVLLVHSTDKLLADWMVACLAGLWVD